MKYFNVLKDIIKYYNNFISKEEYSIINKILYIIRDIEDNKIEDDIIIFVNRILDRIWNLTLTDIRNFKVGDNFCFLAKRVNFDIDINDGSVLLGKSYDYELLTNDNIVESSIDYVYEIVSINYTNNLRTEPLLPIYFKSHKSIKDLNVDSIRCIIFDYTFNKENVGEMLFKSSSKNDNKILFKIDKLFYVRKERGKFITDIDLDTILISYIPDNFFKQEVIKKVRELATKDVKNLINSYMKNEITENELKIAIQKEVDVVIKHHLTNKKWKNIITV